MKTIKTYCAGKLMFFTAVFFLFSNVSLAQTDSIQVAKPDTLQVAKPDTLKVTQNDQTTQVKGKEKKKSKKRKDEFIPYVGVNFNQLYVSEGDLESNIGIGYHFGFNYKRGKFFYWQIGGRYNNAVYGLKDMDIDTSTVYFGVRAIDVPLTGGINFLSPINRLVALRLFVSLVPSFTLGVGDNDLDITKDDINSFIFYGQAGVGVNVAFLVIEAGYNYGFKDLLQDAQSKPGQVFVNLGFRF